MEAARPPHTKPSAVDNGISLIGAVEAIKTKEHATVGERLGPDAYFPNPHKDFANAQTGTSALHNYENKPTAHVSASPASLQKLRTLTICAGRTGVI